MFFINKLSIKGRIMLLSISLILIIIVVSTYSLVSIRNIGGELEIISEHAIPITNALTQITMHQLDQAIHYERLLHLGSVLSNSASNKQNNNSSGNVYFNEQINKFRALDKKITAEFTNIEILISKAIKQVEYELENKEFKHVLHQLGLIKKEHISYNTSSEKVIELLQQGKLQKAEALAKKVGKLETKMGHELEELLQEIEMFTEAAAKRAEEHEHQSEYILLFTSIFSILLGGVLAWIVATSTQKRLSEVANSLTRIAEGDFSEELEQQDEIAIPMRNMRDKLITMITKINSATEQLTTTASSLSTIVTQTNSNIEQQQQETTQASNAMSEMRITVEEVSKNVQSVSNMASQSNDEAKNGASVVNNTVQGISALSKKINEAALVITNVEKDSTNINSVLEVIKGIAEQTNLLALNAAIEAARAGEQGRGFAVVADEVRTLAVRTQESTSEINQIIEKLHSATRQAVMVMTESQTQANGVVEEAALAGTSLETIVLSVSGIAENSEQIASAAHEQNAVTENMSVNIEHISAMASENLDGAKRIHQTSNELVTIASELQESVSQFKL